MKFHTLLIILLTINIRAASQATITGIVTDENTEPVTGAIVRIYHDGILQSGTSTAAKGNYAFKALTPDSYHLKISYLGYKDTVIRHIVLEKNKHLEVNARLMNRDSSFKNVKLPGCVLPRKNKASKNRRKKREDMPQEYSTIYPLPKLIPHRQGDLFGYSDTNGNIIIKPQWKHAGFFTDGKAKVIAVYENYDVYALIDTTGHYLIEPSQQWDGDGMHASNAARWVSVTVKMNGEKTCCFKTRDIYWETTRKLGDNMIAVSGRREHEQWYGITDSMGNFLKGPLRDTEIIKYYPGLAMYVVKIKQRDQPVQNAVLDTSLHTIISKQLYNIVEVLHWHDNTWAMVSYYDVDRYYSDIYSYNICDILNWTPYNELNMQLIDTSGKIVNTLSAYKLKISAGQTGIGSCRAAQSFEGVFLVDSAYKEGLVSIDGKILYPDISFKYHFLEGFGNGYFWVRNGSHAYGTLVDEHNTELMPGLQVMDMDLTSLADYETPNAHLTVNYDKEPCTGCSAGAGLYRLIIKKDNQLINGLILTRNGVLHYSE